MLPKPFDNMTCLHRKLLSQIAVQNLLYLGISCSRPQQLCSAARTSLNLRETKREVFTPIGYTKTRIKTKAGSLLICGCWSWFSSPNDNELAVISLSLQPGHFWSASNLEPLSCAASGSSSTKHRKAAIQGSKAMKSLSCTRDTSKGTQKLRRGTTWPNPERYPHIIHFPTKLQSSTRRSISTSRGLGTQARKKLVPSLRQMLHERTRS